MLFECVSAMTQFFTHILSDSLTINPLVKVMQITTTIEGKQNEASQSTVSQLKLLKTVSIHAWESIRFSLCLAQGELLNQYLETNPKIMNNT